MNITERRQHPRYSTSGLQAAVTVRDPSTIINLYGEVVDISLSGIKIKLDPAYMEDLEGDIKISLFLPDEEIPLSVKGVLKYTKASDVGLHYLEYPADNSLNKVIARLTGVESYK